MWVQCKTGALSESVDVEGKTEISGSEGFSWRMLMLKLLELHTDTCLTLLSICKGLDAAVSSQIFFLGGVSSSELKFWLAALFLLFFW